jgi:hypothetical protein
MATIAKNPMARASAERRFYSGMAIFLTLVVFAGFAPSFYLRNIVPAYPRPNPILSPFVIFHGLVFTAWMALFIAQTQLLTAGRRDLHMKLGVATIALAVAMVPVMYLAGVWQVARANQPPFTDPLSWTIVPLAVIPAFAWLVFEAWRRRREAQWHKRLMLGATILVVAGPGFTRLPLAPPTLTGFAVQLFFGTVLLFAPLFIWDRRSQGKIHPATRHAFVATLLASMVPIVLIATDSWASIAAKLPGV